MRSSTSARTKARREVEQTQQRSCTGAYFANVVTLPLALQTGLSLSPTKSNKANHLTPHTLTGTQ